MHKWGGVVKEGIKMNGNTQVVRNYPASNTRYKQAVQGNGPYDKISYVPRRSSTAEYPRTDTVVQEPKTEPPKSIVFVDRYREPQRAVKHNAVQWLAQQHWMVPLGLVALVVVIVWIIFSALIVPTINNFNNQWHYGDSKVNSVEVMEGGKAYTLIGVNTEGGQLVVIAQGGGDTQTVVCPGLFTGGQHVVDMNQEGDDVKVSLRGGNVEVTLHYSKDKFSFLQPSK